MVAVLQAFVAMSQDDKLSTLNFRAITTTGKATLSIVTGKYIPITVTANQCLLTVIGFPNYSNC